jgi:diguanylate cyclase (GGDEF)-like protein/PAS domain S-box-containing protein
MNADAPAIHNILIVEDEALVAEEARDRLLRHGYRIAGIVDTGEQAIALAEQLQPDLILMDIRLKGSMDGIEAAAHIYRFMDIPVVYTSAHSDRDTLRRARSGAQFGYIVKPFQERDLTMAIELALHRHRIERHLRDSALTHAAILGGISDGVIASDEYGCVRFLNGVAERMTGWRAAEALGRRLEEILALLDESSGHPVEPVTLRDATGEANIDYTPCLLLDKQGRVANIEISATPVLDMGGETVGTVAVFRSISALRRAEEKFRNLLEAAPDAMVIVDADGHIVLVNSQTEKLFGYTRGELLGQTLEILIPERLRKQHGLHRRNYFENPHARAMGTGLDLYGRRRDGSEFPIEVSLSPLDTDEGLLISSTVRDVTERKLAAAALADKDEKLRSFYQMANVGIVMTDLDGNFIEFNGAFEELCGYGRDELLRLDYWSLTPHRYARQELAMQRSLISTGRFGPYEKEYIRKDGNSIPISLNAVLIRGADSQAYIWSFIEDITEKKAKDELINYQANFDALTGLPNRRLFRDRFAQEIKKSNRTGSQLALLFIDLDHFKNINDTLGHNKGDDLLIAAAERIAGCIRESDTLARLGGDEFTVILTNLTERAPIEIIAHKILDALQRPFALGNQQGYISASIGITVYPHDTQQLEDMLKYADRAMYLAKEQGRNRLAFFTPSMQQRAEEKRALTEDLRHALARRQLAVHYQPIIELASGAIVKAEALLRWQHPERGSVNPLDFIPIAEEAGLIGEIGDWVFDQSIAAVARWRAVFGRTIQISVNKSPLQFSNESESDSWATKLAARGLPGDSIAIEITEGLLVKDTPAVKERLIELRSRGIEVSIDDFGTGFSSLSYLKQFDIDYLKIDRAFTGGLASDPSDRALTEAIIVMAHKLGLRTIAEGVETEQQCRILIDLGCDYAQGYLFAKPLPIDEFETLLAQEE